MSREPALFLEDIESACRKIVRYTEGREREEVLRDEMRFEAVLFNLDILWNAIREEVPLLLAQISELRQAEDL